MSGNGGGQGVDAEYNARMATLSEEEHEWAGQAMNFYKYGNIYGDNPDTEITGYYDADGKFVEASAGGIAKSTGSVSDLVGTVNPLTGKNYTVAEAESAIKLMDASQGGVAADPLPEGVELITTTKGEAYNMGPSYMDMEAQQIADNMALMPFQKEQAISESKLGTLAADTQSALMPQYQTMMGNQYDYEGALAASKNNLIQPQEALTKKLIAEQSTNADLRQPVTQKYYDEVNKGVNVQQKVNQASADVKSSWEGANERALDSARQYGANPNSGRGRSALSTASLGYGQALATAGTKARTDAENTTFNRRKEAMSAVPSGAI